MNKINRFLVATIISIVVLGADCQAEPSADKSACVLAAKTLTIDHGTLAYMQTGQGPHILLLHGLFAQKEQWNALACLLADAGHTVIAPDLPGYGQSTGFSITDYKLENQVDLIFRFVSALGLSRFDLGGSSMGGAIAVLYRQQHPEQVRSLAFIGAPMGITQWGPGTRQAIYHGVNPFIPITIDQFDLEMRLLFAKPPTIPETVKNGLIADYLERNRHYQQVWNIVNLYGRVIIDSRGSPSATLILWGTDDGIFDVVGAEPLQKKFPNGQLFKLTNAAHLPMLENTSQVGALYLDFMNNLEK